MRRFALWASARPYRLVLLTIIGLQLLAPLAAALVVLDTLRRGPAAGAVSAVLAGFGVTLIAALIGQDLGWTLGLSAPFLVVGVLSGSLLYRYHSLSLAFQATVVAAIIGVVLAMLLLPAAQQFGDSLRTAWLSLLAAGGLSEAQLAQLDGIAAADLLQVFVFVMFALVIAAVMLGTWWYALVSDRVSFGAEFRQLKLGRVAGIGLMLLVTANLLFDSELLQLASYMSIVGFLFQGLAVLHARSHRDNWHWGILTVVYVALVPPLTGIATMCLSAVGLLDNFFALRARAK